MNLGINKNKFKSIRIKLAFILFISFIIFILSNYFILNNFIHDKMQLLEKESAIDNINRFNNSIKCDLERLSHLANDWSNLDETNKFIQDDNEAYFAKNLYNEALDIIGVDFIIYINKTGDYKYSNNHNVDDLKFQQVSNDFIVKLNESPVAKNVDPDYCLKGIILLDEGPILIASSSILPSSGKGEVLGNIVIGYYLTEQRINALAKQNNQNLKIYILDNSDSIQSKMFYTISDSNPISVQLLNNESAKVNYVLKDINEKPILGLSIEMQRDMIGLVQSGTINTAILLILCSFILIALIVLLIDKNFMSRISSLSNAISILGNQGDFSQRLIKEQKNDEIKIVSDNINIMLDSLENSKNKIEKLNEELDIKVKERTLKLSQTNIELQSEICKRMSIEEEMKFKAYHDNLTNLPNQRYYTEEVNRAIEKARRSGNMLASIFIDLDGYKTINDTMGHFAGDNLLIEVSKELVKVMRISDFVARIGGDEFVIMIENLENIEQLEIIAGKIIKIFSQPFLVDNQECFITASLGIALFPAHGNDAATLLKNADSAMYKAKKNGKNQYQFYNQLTR